MPHMQRESNKKQSSRKLDREDGKYYAVKFMKKHEIIKLKQASRAFPALSRWLFFSAPNVMFQFVFLLRL